MLQELEKKQRLVPLELKADLQIDNMI